MWIFYKHLPPQTKLNEVNKITVKGFRSGSRLIGKFKKGLIKRSKKIRIKDLEAGSLEYHAIIQVDSPVTADNIIENLKGKTVNGLHLRPHRYHRRFDSRDRRLDEIFSSSPDERRQSERRRNKLMTSVLETA